MPSDTQIMLSDRGLSDRVAVRRLKVLHRHLTSSITGLLIWIAESSGPSNEVSQFEYCTLLQEDVLESRNHITSLSRKSPLSTISFNYPRLSEGQKTRLMIFEQGEPDDGLRCRLQHIHSLQGHDYEALSYVWGQPSTKHMIQCSGLKIEITANLEGLCDSFDMPTDPEHFGLTRSVLIKTTRLKEAAKSG
jgi:hypothetical protein